MTTQFRMMILLCALLISNLCALAAEPVELFGGFSAANTKTNTSYGWSASATAYTTPRLGLTADFAGLYSNLNSFTALPDVGLHQHSFLAGPQFRLIRGSHLDTSVKALFGGATGYVPDPRPTGVNSRALEDTSFAALFGSNFDVHVSRRVSLRFSPGLYLTQFGGETQKNFRFSVGPVFHFGGGE